MKKFIFAAFVTLSAVFAFTSCAEDVKIGLSDVAGATFEGTDDEVGLTTMVFSDDSFYTVKIYVNGGEEPATVGTYAVNSENEVIITTGWGIETLTGEGKNKLNYGGVILKKK